MRLTGFGDCLRSAPGSPPVRLVQEEVLINAGEFENTRACQDSLKEIRLAIKAVTWPPKSDRFTIRPGKKANGVRPIRNAFILALQDQGWLAEQPFPLTPTPDPTAAAGSRKGAKFGPMDARRDLEGEVPFTVEWETGNISSSHRAMNKMALGLVGGAISGAVLCVPTWRLACHLTDRIGNFSELWGYLPLWRSVEVRRGYLAIFAVEQDAEDQAVALITKGTDGRALV